MTVTFNQPAGSGGYLRPRDLVGHLVLFTKVHDVQYDLPNPTFGGTRDVATVDIVDLDDDDPEVQLRLLVDKKHIVSRLNPGDTNILARIGQVDTGKGNPAFILEDHDQDDVVVAQAWLNRQNTPPVRQATPTPAPAPTRQNPAAVVTPVQLTPEQIAALNQLTPEQRAALAL